MKSFLSCCLFAIAMSLSTQTIQDLYPSLTPLSFNKAEEQSFQAHLTQCEAVWEKMSKGIKEEDLSKEDRILLMSCDETMVSYWSVEGAGCSWYCGGGPYEISASSTLASPNNDRYAANNAHDLNFKTAWVEGASGLGIGESLTYHFMPQSPRITEIIIANGYVKSQTAWKNNARVKTLKMYVYEQPYAILHLKDQRASHTFTVEPIGHPEAGQLSERNGQQEWTMRFEILEVYPGSKYEDVVLSEIYFDGIDVHCFAAGTQIRMADGSQHAIEKLSIGDQIISVNQASQKKEVATILELAAPIHCQLVSLRFSDGETLLCTPDHRLAVL